MTPANRRLQDRIEALVTKALGTRDADELEQVIQDLREALHEHANWDTGLCPICGVSPRLSATSSSSDYS